MSESERERERERERGPTLPVEPFMVMLRPRDWRGHTMKGVNHSVWLQTIHGVCVKSYIM